MLQNKDGKFITISGHLIVIVDPHLFTKAAKTSLNIIFLVQHYFLNTISIKIPNYLI